MHRKSLQTAGFETDDALRYLMGLPREGLAPGGLFFDRSLAKYPIAWPFLYFTALFITFHFRPCAFEATSIHT